MTATGGEPVGVGLVPEGVPPVAEKDLVGVHAGAGRAEERLGHEAGEQTAFTGQLLNRRLECGERVGRGQRRLHRQVELILPAAHLVMAGLDRDPRRLQRGDDLKLDLAAHPGAALEVAAGVIGENPRGAAVGGEEEELQLRRDQVAEAPALGLSDDGPQDRAAVALVRLAVGGDDIADKPPAYHLGAGIDDGEGGGVWDQVHVGLHLAGRPFHGGAVEPFTVAQDIVETAGWDRDVLDRSGDVGELQLDLRHAGRLHATRKRDGGAGGALLRNLGARRLRPAPAPPPARDSPTWHG